MIFENLNNLFSFEFVRNAFIAGIFVSIGFSALSFLLFLKDCTLLGHGLSDVGFATFAVASALNVSPLFVSIPVMVVVSFFIICFSQSKKYSGSALIAVFSTTALAIGITIAALNKGINSSSVYSYMFGSIFSITKNDLITATVLNSLVILVFILFYNKMLLTLLDEDFAKSKGLNVIFYKFLVASLTAVVTILGIKMVGTLLVSSLMVFPCIISKKIARSSKMLVVFSLVFSVLSFIFGIFLSFTLNIPAGASIVFVNVAFMVVFSLLGCANLFKHNSL